MNDNDKANAPSASNSKLDLALYAAVTFAHQLWMVRDMLDAVIKDKQPSRSRKHALHLRIAKAAVAFIEEIGAVAADAEAEKGGNPE